MAPAADKKRIVVLGGGYAGSVIAKDKALQAAAEVTLIDRKTFFEHNVATLRAALDPTVGPRIMWEHSAYLGNAKLVVGAAKEVTPSAVLLEDGAEVPYDILVVAAGSTYSSPLAKTDPAAAAGAKPSTSLRLKDFANAMQQIKGANSILIVGGGPVGVELAGEIVTELPGKKVTIVHSGQRLLATLKPAVGAAAQSWLVKHGVEVILDNRVDISGASTGTTTYTTSKGKSVSADLAYLCAGQRANTSFMTARFGDKIDSRGLIKVDEYLRVTDDNRIFALGDCASVEQAKMAFTAGTQALSLLANIRLLVKGSTKLVPYKFKPGEIMIVSMGKKYGVAQLPAPMGVKKARVGCMPTMIKSKDLFIGKTRKDMGITTEIKA
eukprot:jgi/Chlat1/387/Chrsp10S08629